VQYYSCSLNRSGKLEQDDEQIKKIALYPDGPPSPPPRKTITNVFNRLLRYHWLLRARHSLRHGCVNYSREALRMSLEDKVT